MLPWLVGKGDVALVLGVLLVLWAVLQWNNKLPSTKSIQELMSTLNSRGGNIMILTFLSWAFFKVGMALFYNILDRIADGRITPDNAVVATSIAFVTGTAFGGAFGALLKTMTGESSKGRVEDYAPPQHPVEEPVPVEPAPVVEPETQQGAPQ